jgi:hypothetical protein
MFDFGRFADDVSGAYQRDIVQAGKEAELIILVTFLTTFAIVRLITHAIRDDRFKHVLRNVQTSGGLHIHHLVPGIILLILSGYLGIGLAGDVSINVAAVLFGIGAALTLDEFALWLHLEDVYWAKEGRDSIDAVVIVATILGIGLLGNAFFVDVGRFLLHLVGVESA